LNAKSLSLVFALVLSGCALQLPWAPDSRVARAFYHDPTAPSVTLITMVSNRGKTAGHSALLINASQRVMYDPAGTWFNKDVPERADLLYGMTPKMLEYYLDYHARDVYHVVLQTKIVPLGTAETMMKLAIENGASASGFCASNTSHILSRTPGFKSFPVSIWPKNAVAAFGALPGVTTRKVFQSDKGKFLHE